MVAVVATEFADETLCVVTIEDVVVPVLVVLAPVLLVDTELVDDVVKLLEVAFPVEVVDEVDPVGAPVVAVDETDVVVFAVELVVVVAVETVVVVV